MASGRPVLFVGPEHCESADTIRRNDCGLTVRLGDVQALIDGLNRLASDPDLCHEMGRRGRATFLASHEKEDCCTRWNAMISELLEGARTAPVRDLRQLVPNRRREIPSARV
jgi:glycosyltransferase involved in cell wall biosynthesis